MIDYMVLGVIGALALFAWLVIRNNKKRGGCSGGCASCGMNCPSRQQEDKK